MGKIPEFQRRKLASSVVGTPGVDTSGALLTESIGRDIGRITSTLISVLGAKQKILNDVEANKKAIDFEVDYDKAIRQVQLESIANPDQAIQQTIELGNSLGNAFLSTIESDPVRQSVARLQQGVIGRKIKAVSTWASGQQIINAGVNLTASFNNLTVWAESTDDLKVLDTIFVKTEEIGTVAKGVLGAKSRKFIDDGRKSIAMGFLYGQMDRNPVRAGEMLGKEVFKKILDGKERKKFEKDIANAIKTKADKDRVKILTDNADRFIDITKKYGDGTLKVSELDLLKLNMQDTGSPEEDIKFVDIMRDTLLSSAVVTSVDNNKTIAKLANQWSSLAIDIKEGTAKGSAENIHRFLLDVAVAHKKKIITKDTQDAFITKATPTLNNKIKAETERVEGSFAEGFAKFFKGDAFEAVDVGFATISGWAKTNAPETVDETSGRLIKDYMTAVKILEKSSGEGLTEVQSKEVADRVIVRETRKQFPGYELENLYFTADETGLTVKQVFDLLEKERLRKK